MIQLLDIRLLELRCDTNIEALVLIVIIMVFIIIITLGLIRIVGFWEYHSCACCVGAYSYHM